MQKKLMKAGDLLFPTIKTILDTEKNPPSPEHKKLQGTI